MIIVTPTFLYIKKVINLLTSEKQGAIIYKNRIDKSCDEDGRAEHSKESLRLVKANDCIYP